MMAPDPSQAVSLETEIARLRDPDLQELQARWRAVTGKRAPVHLPKHLMLRLLAYRIQADAMGDLDAATIRILDRIASGNRGTAASIPLPGGRCGRRVVDRTMP